MALKSGLLMRRVSRHEPAEHKKQTTASSVFVKTCVKKCKRGQKKMPVLRRKFYFGVVGQQDMQPMQTVVRVQKLSGLE